LYIKKNYFTITLIITLLVMVAFNVSAEKDFRNPRLNLQGTSLNGFTGQSSVLFPLNNSEDSIFYTDFRSRISNDTASEWNLGLGYRKKSYKYDNRLYGVYAYKDRREEYNHIWDMWTVGGEILTDSFDLRLNGYLADNEKVALPQGDTVVVEDNKIIYQKGYVQSMDGIDFEFGKRFIEADGLFHNVGAYLKIYTFFADEVDNMYGKELKINKLVGDREGTNYKFGVEWQEDNIRGSNLKASFEVSIPFGEKADEDKENKKESDKEIIETRMTEKPERDVDVVIGQNKTGTKEASGKVAYDPVTGNKLNDTEYITADTEDIVTKINESDAKVIILLGDKGEFSLDGSIKLDEGQKLLSPTGSLMVSSDKKGSRATYFKPEGKQAKLNFESFSYENLNGKAGLVLKEYNTVSGLKIVDNSGLVDSAGIYKESLDVDSAPDIRGNSISNFAVGIYFDEIKGKTVQNKLNNLARFNTEYENINKITEAKVVDVHDHIIKDWYDLNAIRINMDGAYLMKEDLNSDTAGYEELASDTANQNKGWNPIGDRGLSPTAIDSENNSYPPFQGVMAGNGNIISALNINRGSENYIGLFGVNKGTIENVSLEGIDVIGDFCVGGLTGVNNGKIIKSYATGYGDNNTVDVEGNPSVGGLVGFNDDEGKIFNSYATVDVTGNKNVGGLVGYNNGGNIENNYATGDVTGNEDAGGLVGEDNYGQIISSYATGNVSSSGGRENYVGGLVGYTTGGIIENSYAKVDVIGNYNVGGLVGRNYKGNIENSYATGDVTGEGDYAGGLVGKNDEGKITNSYATGDVSGDSYVGGLVGGNYGELNKSYATGDVAGNNDIGGLVGVNEATPDTEVIISASYATGNVIGNNFVGGLIGTNAGGANITVSYATGDVTGEGDYAGGLVGLNIKYAIITASYSIGEVSGNDSVGGLVGLNAATAIDSISLMSPVIGRDFGGLEGKVIEAAAQDMKTRSLYTDDTLKNPWDFDNIWKIDEGTTSPYLKNNIPDKKPVPEQNVE